MAWFKATDRHEACSDSINSNSPKEASVDNQQAIQEQPVELIDSGGARQSEPESSAGLIHKEKQASTSWLWLMKLGTVDIHPLLDYHLVIYGVPLTCFWVIASFLDIDLVKLMWISVGWSEWFCGWYWALCL